MAATRLNSCYLTTYGTKYIIKRANKSVILKVTKRVSAQCLGKPRNLAKLRY